MATRTKTAGKGMLLGGKRDTYGPVMLDVIGLRLQDEDFRRIRHPLTGGVILFARNYQSREQLMALTAEIKRERPDLLIAVDHEGGRVQRFRYDGFTRLPAMRILGEMYGKDPKTAVRAAVAVGYVLAAELRACGIDLSFTPVLDLDYGVSAVIGNRSFSRNPNVVTVLAQNLHYGLSMAGMANCGKHFPGHGYATGDSHTEIPVDDRELEVILAEDASPYRALDMTLAGVMPAHVIYPKVDSLPAGFSKKWISILRNDLGFDGVVFSDDLSMEGASVAGGIIDRANAAFGAGCDMVLVCNAPAAADELLGGLPLRSDDEMRALRRRMDSLVPKQPAKDWDSLQAEPRYQRAKALVESITPTR